MRVLKLTLACLLAVVAPVAAQQTQSAYPSWNVTPPVFVIPASAVNGSGTLSSTCLTWPLGTPLCEEAANHLFQRNTTSAERLSVANTYTSSTNYEAFSVDWQTQANTALVGTRTAATGTTRQLRLLSQASSAADSYFLVQIGHSSPFIRAGFGTAGGGFAGSTASTGTLMQVADWTNTATSGTVIGLGVTPTYNQSSGTAANTDLLINRTQTAVGSGAQNLWDAQVSNTSKLRLDNTGALIWNTASGPAITQGSGTGITVNNTGEARNVIYKVTIDRTAFVAAAVTADVTVATLPAKTQIIGVMADLTQTFACTATCTSSTLSMVFGRGSGGAQWLASFDADAATAQFGDADAELGTTMTRAAAIQGGSFEAWGSTQAAVLRLTSGTGNIGNGSATNLSQGSVTLYINTRVFP